MEIMHFYFKCAKNMNVKFEKKHMHLQILTMEIS